jgi:hypothetical protein
MQAGPQLDTSRPRNVRGSEALTGPMNTTLPCAPEPPHAGYTRFAEKTYTQKQDRTDTL